MLSLTIPLWLMLTIAGVPTLLLLMLIMRLLRMKRKKLGRHAVRPQFSSDVRLESDFNDQIHQQLLEQQIDAVFNMLVTVIETERLKLKALASHALPTRITATKPSAYSIKSFDAPGGALADDEPRPAKITLGQSIAALSEDGLAPEEIARHLGLSQSEVALAMKMNNGRAVHLGSKMKAVA